MSEAAVDDVILFQGKDIQGLPRKKLLEALRVGYDEIVLLREAQSEDGRAEAEREEVFQRTLRAQHDYFGTIAEYQSRLMDSATAYNQIIILGGYVAFFGVWSSVKDDIPRWMLLASGGAMLLSLIVFISWTVFNMFQLQSQNMRTLKTFGNGVEGFEDRFRAALASGLQDMGWLHKLWTYVVIASASTGLIAALLLSYGTLASMFANNKPNSEQSVVVTRPAQQEPIPATVRTISATKIDGVPKASSSAPSGEGQ